MRGVAAAAGMAPLVVEATRGGAGQGSQGEDGRTRRNKTRALQQGGESRLEGRAGILLVPRAVPTKQDRALRLQFLPRPIHLWIGVRPLWTGVRRVLTGVQRPQRPPLRLPPTGVHPLRRRAAGAIPLPQVQTNSRPTRRRRQQRRPSGATPRRKRTQMLRLRHNGRRPVRPAHPIAAHRGSVSQRQTRVDGRLSRRAPRPRLSPASARRLPLMRRLRAY